MVRRGSAHFAGVFAVRFFVCHSVLDRASSFASAAIGLLLDLFAYVSLAHLGQETFFAMVMLQVLLTIRCIRLGVGRFGGRNGTRGSGQIVQPVG